MNRETTPQAHSAKSCHGIKHSRLYHKAFTQYLRRGTSPELFLKAKTGSDHVVDKYIWLTQGDDKVRPDHAALEGELIAWDDPPDIGHPGEDYNCRCIAQPYLDGIDPADLKEVTFETVIHAAEDNPTRLDSIQMAEHYRNGNGEPRTLQEIGHLREIIRHVQNYPIDKDGHSIARRGINYFADQIRKVGPGRFHDTFSNTYDFIPVEWAHGESTLSAEANGYVSALGPFLILNLTVDYSFSDKFEDPLSIAEFQRRRGIQVPIVTFEPGKPYGITGTWRTRIEAVVYRDETISTYKPRDKK